MEEMIRQEIARFVSESSENRFPGSRERYFDEPLVGFAAADDPLFGEYKGVIGSFHLTPQEVMAQSPETENAKAASVICWVLPVAAKARESNRKESLFPSREWAQTRSYGEDFNVSLRRHLQGFLEGLGHKGIAPQLLPGFQVHADPRVGLASIWSERHAAYAAGLGSFSLSDGFITPAGIAHRCGSVVTDLPLSPTRRSLPDHRYNCLFYREGRCGACIGRCPTGAISRKGHDKMKCRSYVYDEAPRAVGESYGVPHVGCGLCQTKVPCEWRVPPGKASRQ